MLYRKKQFIRGKGFTLIELMVAVGIFSITAILLITITLGFSSNRQRVKNEEESLAAVRAFLSTMEKEIRYGTNFPTICENGCPALSFVTKVRDDSAFQRIDYAYDSAQQNITRAEQRTYGACSVITANFPLDCFVSLTPPSIIVNNATFFVHNTDPAQQPIVVVTLDITIGTNPKEQVSYKLSETYSPRLPQGTGTCEGRVDIMFVLDRSGSINPGELSNYKTALNAIIPALVPSFGGVHIGTDSFNNVATLDIALSFDQTAIIAAINGLVSGGSTNISAGIDTARTEFASARVNTPRILVLISDGVPTVPNGKINAENSAIAARAEGIEIYVLGVGVLPIDAAWMRSSLANDPAHYIDVTNFGTLENILKNTPICQNI